VRAHIIFGIVGFVVGLVLYVVLYSVGVRLITSTPIAGALAILFFATIFGLMFGGFVALRPDHDVIITSVPEAVDAGIGRSLPIP